ncbi:MAG: hypothetical protein HYU36_08175 [Planctomycetes bacterium]|nr:hypothetical protein [Planctomycetota bacterium]
MKSIPVALILVLLLGAALSAPYLCKDFWFDERWTITDFAPLGFWGVFTEYRQPNNHMVFTSVLVLWMKVCTLLDLPEKCLRLLPWLFSLGAVAALFLSVRAWRGPRAAVWAGVLLVTSHFFLLHSCQVRGYALSCLEWSLGFGLTFRILSRPSGPLLTAYALVATLAVGTVPTNLPIFFCLGLWMAAELKRQGDWSRAYGKLRAAACLFVPLPGLAFYLVHPRVRQQFFGHSMNPFFWKDVRELYEELGHRLLPDFLWLLPLVAAGLYAAWRGGPHGNTQDVRLGPSLPLFALASVIPLAGGLFLAYYARNFVPMLPWWSAACGLALDEAFVWLETGWPRARRWAAALLVVVVLSAAAREVLLFRKLGGRWVPAAAVSKSDTSDTSDSC